MGFDKVGNWRGNWLVFEKAFSITLYTLDRESSGQSPNHYHNTRGMSKIAGKRQHGSAPPSTLGMAYAEAGRFREATSMAERAAALAAAGDDAEGAKVNRALAEQYRSGQPYRDLDNSTNSLPKQQTP
jgi:hypothetical protein